MKLPFLFFSTLVVIAMLLVLNQMWLWYIEPALFWKILITLGIIGTVGTVLLLIYTEFVEDKKLKKDKFVD